MKRIINTVKKLLEQPLSLESGAVKNDEGQVPRSLLITDFMDVKSIQQLQDTFAEATDYTAVIVDPDGTPVTTPSNQKRLCYLSLEDEACSACQKAEIESNQYSQPLLQKNCLNLGMIDQSFPIIMDGYYLGSLVVGHCYVRAVEADCLKTMAKNCRLSVESLKKRLDTFPGRYDDTLARPSKLLTLFVRYLTDACRKNYAAANANEERLRTIATMSILLNSAGVLLCVVDPEKLTLEYVSEAMEATFAVSIGDRCCDVFCTKEAPCECGQAGGKNKIVDPDDCIAQARELQRPDLNKTYEVTDRMIIWHTGKPMRLFTVSDVTERKALVVSEAANEERRNFFSRMSHELRTPLNGVLGMTQLALNANPEPKQRDYLQKITSSATVLLGIINDALDFSKIEAGKLELAENLFSLEVDVVEPIKDMFAAEIIKKNLSFDMTIAGDIPDVLNGDSLRLSQILINLIANAIKFTARGGIFIDISLGDSSKEHCGLVHLYFSVRDTGIGMTQEDMGRLFVPFVQAGSTIARQYGGTGLGLSIARALAHKMGGNICVESTLEMGSTFYFDVFIAKGKERRVRSDLRKNYGNLELSHCHILVVEDNIINQEIAAEMLHSFGAQVDIASNGEEGVKAVMRTVYDLIFMDMLMPCMNGVDATRAIRKLGGAMGSVPIIAMTANAMVEDQQDCLEAGMNDHLSKPISIQSLTRVLRAWLPIRCMGNDCVS